MAIRLIKIAKELNVGTSTIVEYLNNSGFEIDNKPTAKVTDEMYSELVKEFQSSIAVKEKADKLTIGGHNRPVSKDEPVADIPKKASIVEPVPPPKEEKPKSEPIIIEKKEIIETPIVEVPVEEIPVIETSVVEIPVVETPALKVDEVITEPIPEIVEEAKELIVEEIEEEIEDKPKIGLKVKGKINLDNIGKKKPTPKPQEKKKEEPKPNPVVEVPKVEEVVEVSNKIEIENESLVEKEQDEEQEKKSTQQNVIKADAPQLKGLKILGKIDTDKLKKPKKKKKKPEQKSDSAKPGAKTSSQGGNDPQKRRRRKRKKVPVVNTNTPSNNTSANPNNRNRRGGAPARGGNKKRTNARNEVKEVSQKEIDEKIKATMARLSGSGKKKRQKMRRDHRERHREKAELQELEKEITTLQLTEFISVSELASLMDVSVTDVITKCMNLGVIVSINQRLDAEIIEVVAEEFGHEVEFISAEEHDLEEDEIVDDPEDLLPRSPIITVMGHVDHGKTSLLDYIREANVADSEAGGITQHIGAYEVNVGEDNKRIIFLDTPGHEAFTAMRARGAKVTDVAIIIVSADDDVMPQTKEAISHAQAADVPIIFAINKIDKDGANPERIKQRLAEMNFQVEDWGGKYQSQDISAKNGTNIDLLLEKILLEAEILELKANPDREAMGTVLEASLDKGRGFVTKILVQTGTLKVGDSVVSGNHSGRIKAMYNDKGNKVKSVGPSTPVLILGLSGAPQAGEKFKVVGSDQEARQIASKRAQILREQSNRASKRISLDEIGRRLALGTFKELNLIIKGDVDGSIEALADSLIKESIETVQVNVIHKAVGQIIESDVLLASASDAIIIGFQVRPSLSARKLAEREGVEIKMYSVIYKAIDEVRSAIEGLLEPTIEEKIIAQVEVRETYKISRVGMVAGCYVQDGKIARSTFIRIVRDGIVIYPTKEGVKGEITSLKRFKDDVKEVKNGMECGITIKNYNDLKVGDIIEGYEIIETKRTLDK